MSAEFLAINKALEWATLNSEFLDKKELVILSDSRSSLEALKSTATSKYSSQEEHAYRITEILQERNFSISLQWVPSHIGLAGNEAVDNIAKDAHALPTTIPCPLSIEEAKKVIKKAATQSWQMMYDTLKGETHIGEIKPTLGFWPWAHYKCRAIETAVTRLRIGHIELNAHLHRIGQTESPLCPQCRTPETISHYLLYCRRFAHCRNKLFSTIISLGILTINKKILLGGGNFPESQQIKIAKALENYLKESGRLYGLALP